MSKNKTPEPSERSELRELADELAEWRTKSRSQWTSEDRAAYRRWSRRQIERLGPGPVTVDVRSPDERDQPPHYAEITLTFDTRGDDDPRLQTALDQLDELLDKPVEIHYLPVKRDPKTEKG
jgi:hypothetical protein